MPRMVALTGTDGTMDPLISMKSVFPSNPRSAPYGDDKSKRNLDGHIAYAPALNAEQILAALQSRVSLIRDWQLFLDRYPVIVMPVSQQLPFRDNQDMDGQEVFSAMLDAQRSLLATPVLGFPSVAVPTRLSGGTPVGVQVVAGRFREDLCLDAAEAIERHVTHGDANRSAGLNVWFQRPALRDRQFRVALLVPLTARGGWLYQRLAAGLQFVKKHGL